MKRLTDYTSYADAQSHFASDRLWELFDGDRSVFNIAHECVDRHAGRGREAVIVCRADGTDEKISFDDLSRDSSQFAHYLERKGVQKGDRVAIMLEPSREFYTAMFGVIKRGAIAVPLFTLFGLMALLFLSAAAAARCLGGGEAELAAGPPQGAGVISCLA